jgi:hypothetical protein
MKKRYPILFLLFYYSIISAQEAKPLHDTFMYDLQDNGFAKTVDPRVFSPSCNLYSQPDSNSAVIQVLPFGEPLKIVQAGEDVKEIIEPGHTTYIGVKWYKTDTKRACGYIKATDVASQTFHDKADYYIITDIVPKDNPNASIRIFKYDLLKKQFIDTLEVPGGGGDYSMQVLDHSGWKNVDQLFRMTSVRPYCGGGQTENFIVDANGKLALLLSSGSSGGEMGESHSTSVWLPVTFQKGKVLLLENGDVEHAFDIYTGNVYTIPFPSQPLIPHNEMIIMKESTETPVLDKKGGAIENADGSYRSTVKNRTWFYQWNGKKLVPLK